MMPLPQAPGGQQAGGRRPRAESTRVAPPVNAVGMGSAEPRAAAAMAQQQPAKRGRGRPRKVLAGPSAVVVTASGSQEGMAGAAEAAGEVGGR